MPATAAELNTPPVDTGTGPTNTVLGWSVGDTGVAGIAPLYATTYGVSAGLFMDRATLDKNMARLPLGVIEGVNLGVNPVMMLSQKPLNPTMKTGTRVLVKGTGFASIDNQIWPITVVSVPNSQFQLTGANTTSESGQVTPGGTVTIVS